DRTVLQGEAERGTTADLALHPDAAAVRLDDALGYVQAETETAAVGDLELLEALEDPVEVTLRNAPPGIADGNTAAPGSGVREITMDPPDGVNWMALRSRFESTCRIRS